MTDYNKYVTAINKTFDYLSKMKAGWDNLDNNNYIESIEEYKQLVIDHAKDFKKEKSQIQQEESIDNLEAL